MNREVVVPEVLPAEREPSWDRARAILAEMGGWEKIIEFGRELQGLRERYFAQGDGGGGDHKSANYRENITSSARGRSAGQVVTRATITGWQEVVRRELDMTPQAALRAIERGVHTWRLQLLRDGKAISYPVGGEPRIVRPTAEMRARAAMALNEVVLGANAGHAFAGVVGESTRTGRKGTSDRAPVDHEKNIEAALKKLRTSLPQWKRLSSDARKALEDLWGEVKSVLPETW